MKARHKCAVVVGAQLPAGLAANAAAVLSVTLGHRVEGLVGHDVLDADGVTHAGISRLPLPILTSPTVTTIIRAAAEDDEIFFVAFSALAQSCRTYEEYTARMAATATADLDSVGVALHGPRKRVDRLVGSLPLLR